MTPDTQNQRECIKSIWEILSYTWRAKNLEKKSPTRFQIWTSRMDLHNNK